MTLREAVATGRKIKRARWPLFYNPADYDNFTLEDAIADDWETEKVKKEGWVNVYQNNKIASRREMGMVYETEQEAKEERRMLAVTTVKITWEE